ncbi:MmpS family transport accessory protein [Rhodococcus sp. NPDC058514]|uniref:MmpS family transport accessory protein n=1 Tax=unclassified Rhodococcus (in: high G+C Gram-positive bacteria) TaxID=192944 RepID=UPI0036601113
MSVPPQDPQHPGQYPAPGGGQGGQPGQFPPPGQYPPPGYYQQQPPPAKRKKWPWILGGIVLVCILAFAGCAALLGGAANEIDKELNEVVSVTYEVTSDGPTASSITYTSGDSANTAQDNGASLPWSRNVTVSGLKIVSLTAQAGESATTITCTVRQGSTVISEQTSTGQFAVVSCSGTAE